MFRLIVFAALAFIAYQVISFFMGTKSFRRQLQRDLAALEKLIAEFKEGLIPFEEDEFKILSSNPVIKSNRKSNAIFSRGVLSTIYQEPLIAFSMKENYNEGEVILIAQSDKTNFRLMYSNKNTEVFVNEVRLGSINESHQLLLEPSHELVAQIEMIPGERYAKILLHNKDTAHLNLLEDDGLAESERVFSLFHDFEHNDSDELVILTLYHLFIYSKTA